MAGRRLLWLATAGILATALLPGCGDDDAAPETTPFTLTVTPGNVFGAVPGAAWGLLVTVGDEGPDGGAVDLTATAEGATITVEPARIEAGEIAEVTVVADAATEERPLDIVITARRGEVEHSVATSTVVVPWEDDRGPYARDLLEVFATWLGENRPDLGIGPETEFSGSMVAPQLLVVSHYLFRSGDWEAGMSWHVMTPPDDWADLYLRPGDSSVPTLAFRLASQAAAFEDGVVEITETTPPDEVVR